jgi:REP element-mobilizing transposase RayT
MTMPDHIHLLTALLDRELRVAAFLQWFERWFNESYGACGKWQWQAGGFDRLLRTSESIHEKWNYVRENPVQADLVAHWKQWPYQKGFGDDE